MAKTLEEWINTDVQEVRDKPIVWLSQYHFFRDPSRLTYLDSQYFFSPADGIILYQQVVEPDECLLDIKGKSYSLRDAIRDESYSQKSLVIGVFMTFFDVHVNRIPYSGRLSYRELDPIDTLNHPMLDVERALLDELRIPLESAGYLHHNQRMVNTIIYASQLSQSYHVLQIADYDVSCITPFILKQNHQRAQGERFSQIRYGSQVDLIIPLSERYEFNPIQQPGYHIEAGLDPLVRIGEK
ncbi:Putative phosphatidylserine decarboxylase [Candidatus Glomeribacter gigasporarum BEG34]|uniref:Putative phosphatidylserine decarboxylase n=1 Tax=Candidatus Glomeribacter gigasporarum BEG34 TaxID=1070319 RepID=G2J9D8_9BURK|nr:phosphatidylserine decarboxylase [Candidatus Glomeribacter gigasporarum]CCD29385.1 Putative phosphatidylserine decarboxylase [Candidatus Glomeribacter gigasporarum BEG34]